MHSGGERREGCKKEGRVVPRKGEEMRNKTNKGDVEGEREKTTKAGRECRATEREGKDARKEGRC